MVEPRLTGAEWRSCTGVECGRTEPAGDEPCPEIIESHAEALRVLATRSACGDAAITALRTFTHEDPTAWSDIAAAYYLRAHREDRQSQLLEALEVAEHAVAATPRNPAAFFNLALIQESLGLHDLAITSWETAATLDQSQWRNEAQQHLDRLRRRPRATGSTVPDHQTIRDAIALAQEGQTQQALTELNELQDRSEHVRAQVHNTRGYVLERRSQYLEALAEYDLALEMFARLGDIEKTVTIHRSKAGILRVIGQYELAWREALIAARDTHRVASLRRRQSVLIEAAVAAAALDRPATGLLYTDIALEMLATEPDDILLASTRRVRAEIALQLGRNDLAERELAEAMRLTDKYRSEVEALRKSLRVRIQQVRGRSVLKMDPRAAMRAFTEALKGLPRDEMKTLRAELFAQRAEAARLAGDNSEGDLQAALRELREEETRLLDARERGEGERYWGSYFSRFDAIHDQLVANLAEGGEWRRAFDYDERSRAHEPLDLIMKREVTPEPFRRLLRDGEPLDLGAVRANLPPGTVLLQFSVLEDRTLTWIVTSEGARLLRQSATRRDVTRWSNTLHRAVRWRDANTFYRTSTAVFDRLFAAPLRGVQNPRRIVIIPDGVMHGIPFAALYDTAARRYLIEIAPVAIAPSATLYVFSTLRDQALPKRDQSALLLGDPTFRAIGVASGLKPLPHARNEVAHIEEVYRPLMKVEVRIGDEATVDAFLDLARGATIIHFAGHSIVNAQQPWHSVLLLAQSNGHGGAIEAQELIEKLTLNRTRLVVLAACTSAGGLPIGPEGVAPLVRPLITAGVPAVVGSLWDVEDATAETLSVSFHRHYGQGSDAAKALQAAQIEMLRSGRHGLQSVFAWAPFQVIGHASSPSEPTQIRLNGGTTLGIHRKDSLQRDDGLHPQQ